MSKLHILWDGSIQNAVRVGDDAAVAELKAKQAEFYNAGSGHPNHLAEWARRQATAS